MERKIILSRKAHLSDIHWGNNGCSADAHSRDESRGIHAREASTVKTLSENAGHINHSCNQQGPAPSNLVCQG